MPHLYILTGASRGLGLALAQQLLSPSHHLLCIARSIKADLAAQAKACGCTCEQWTQDLADAPAAAERLRAWLRTFDPAACASATLINNAGVISRIGALEDSDDADVSNALRVGLEAPMLLTSAFLDATRHWTAPRKVLNVSSGLGRRAMAGSAAYCAAKAGMDHFTRSVALEQAALPHGARIVSLAPGVIDTDMQVQLRGSDPAGFPDRGRFVQLQVQGQLSTPDDAARRLLAYLARHDFGVSPVADVRDA
ncbi:SDR family NAD(P)-dependent oxidoreductase [Caldimonas caldifontis]|uniref:Short-chain dehydrogenase n=1 Tax=Caldimonas caldifontis TaxID=1452508 RepID=A0A2S5SYM7_9BURK|nr:SDR family NAD(P)-dependent oxidoreductase [Caldimonas caldifontis]PPE67802.1 short-chain dehydrogenase [Caldimonas caldifontis]